MVTGLAAAAAFLVCVSANVTDGGQARPAAWTVTTGEIRVTCPLTVGGSFDARTTSLDRQGRGGFCRDDAERGAVVDLSTLDTGISLRNEHMARHLSRDQQGRDFDRAVLSGIAVGDLSGGSKEGARPFTARLLLHGTVPVLCRVARR